MSEDPPDAALRILHVDMDAFFASVEQRDRPELRGKPVIVGAGPHERGVVSTCSYEARKFGVHSAMPSREAFRLCPQGVFVRPDMERYMAASAAVFEIFDRYTPLVQGLYELSRDMMRQEVTVNGKTKKMPILKPIATAVAEWKAENGGGGGTTPPDDGPDNPGTDGD